MPMDLYKVDWLQAYRSFAYIAVSPSRSGLGSFIDFLTFGYLSNHHLQCPANSNPKSVANEAYPSLLEDKSHAEKSDSYCCCLNQFPSHS